MKKGCPWCGKKFDFSGNFWIKDTLGKPGIYYCKKCEKEFLVECIILEHDFIVKKWEG